MKIQIFIILINLSILQPTVDTSRADRKVSRITDADFRSDMETIISDLENDLNQLLSDMNDETFEVDEAASRAENR